MTGAENRVDTRAGKPSHVVDGVYQGGRALGFGVWDAVSGVVQKPIKGFKEVPGCMEKGPTPLPLHSDHRRMPRDSVSFAEAVATFHSLRPLKLLHFKGVTQNAAKCRCS